jgi:hypothetical protein
MIATPVRATAPEDFWLPVLVTWGTFMFMFVFCQLKTDNSYIDVFWGISFIVPLTTLLILFGV